MAKKEWKEEKSVIHTCVFTPNDNHLIAERKETEERRTQKPCSSHIHINKTLFAISVSQQ